MTNPANSSATLLDFSIVSLYSLLWMPSSEVFMMEIIDFAGGVPSPCILLTLFHLETLQYNFILNQVI